MAPALELMQISANGKRRFYSFMEFYCNTPTASRGKNLSIVLLKFFFCLLHLSNNRVTKSSVLTYSVIFV